MGTPAAGHLVTEPLAAEENSKVSNTRRVVQQLRNWLFDALRRAPFGIDVFEGTLEGLLLAEAEFDSAADADALTLPSSNCPEVCADNRFTGGQLVRGSREGIRASPPEYGIRQR